MDSKKDEVARSCTTRWYKAEAEPCRTYNAGRTSRPIEALTRHATLLLSASKLLHVLKTQVLSATLHAGQEHLFSSNAQAIEGVVTGIMIDERLVTRAHSGHRIMVDNSSIHGICR